MKSISRKRLLIISLLVFLGVIFYFSILKDLPSPTTLSSPEIPESTQIVDRNGELIYTIYTQKNRASIPLSKIPKYVREATIAIEDKDFYRHGPIDPRGIVRALYQTIFKRQLQGGSTITQQLVKTALLTPERTIPRKIKEFLLAAVVEQLYSKDQILELYLNHVPYGGTAYGIETAAQTFFDKPTKDLTLAEAALLAGLPSAPTYYSPFTHLERAKTRQKEVLRKMEEQSYITSNERQQAEKDSFKLTKVKDQIKAPHFVFYIKELLEEKYGQKMVGQGGLKITTSLDLELQDFVQETVASEVAKLKRVNASNGAALVTNPKTGEILAMVGSRSYFDEEIDGNVNVTLAPRQPGSAIKPINYAVGLMKGYTAATTFIDQKTCFPNPGKEPYCPVNYDGKFHGAVGVRYALANSYNIPAVKMLKLVGVEEMIATASAMGITTFKDPSRYGLSLTLGGGEVTMLELAQAYGTFANQGYRIDLHPILKVINRKGEILEEYKPPDSPIFGKKILPESVAFILSHILLDNGARSAAFGESSFLVVPGQQVSVKTGTTDDKRDNWTIGWTPSILAAAWVGNNDNSPMDPTLASGITGAAPIWNRIMRQALKDKKPESPKIPTTVVGAEVCSTSGKLPPAEGTPDRCPTRFEYFVKGTVPKDVDNSKTNVSIDKATGDLAKPGQTDNVEDKEQIVITDPLGDSYCLSCPHPE
ncbi:penicillin-binding protein [Candidatus Microgenomates bacterium]|nr:penicillin-binding protein [Candidatus Microgenomates bacterium]